MAKKMYEAKVSFFTEVEAENQAEADVKINQLLDALGKVNTPCAWDDVSWEYSNPDA